MRGVLQMRRKWIGVLVLLGVLIGWVVFARIYWSGKISGTVKIKDVATGELRYEEISFEVYECEPRGWGFPQALYVRTYRENISLWVEIINWSVYPLDAFYWFILRVKVGEAPEGSGLEFGDFFLNLTSTNWWSAYRNLTVAGEYVFDLEFDVCAAEVEEDTVVTFDIWFYLCSEVREEECPCVLWSGCIRVSL